MTDFKLNAGKSPLWSKHAGTRKEIWEYLLAHPHASAKSLTEAFPSIPLANIKYHLGKLREFGKVELVGGQGRKGSGYVAL